MTSAPSRPLLTTTLALLLATVPFTFARTSEASTPPWAPGVNYSIGSRATYGATPFDIEYSARQAHTSQTGWEPPNVPALWEIPTPINCVFWTPQVKYTLNTLVVYNDTTYKAIQAHNSESTWTPPSTPALWSPVASSNCSTSASETFEQAY